MDWIDVDSSMIKSVGYDKSNQSLMINFNKGKIYSYANVPQAVYIEMTKAESKGAFFHQHIKGKYEAVLYNPEL